MNLYHRNLLLTGLAILFLGAALLVVPQFAATQSQSVQPFSAEAVPAFHAQPPSGDLPPTMDPSLFADKLTFNAYVVAGRVKKVLYQQPCYCHCDRSQGHGSLLDCFVSRHGAGCDICQKEDFYSYEQTHKGKTAAQIRDGIMRGEWERVDITKYTKDPLPAQKAAAK